MWTRLPDGGRPLTHRPARHSVAGRTGRGWKPPPQFGQTLDSRRSTQSAQNVHSKVQIRASTESGGRSRSQLSQFGLSSSAMSGNLASVTQAGTTENPRIPPTGFAGHFRGGGGG